MAVNYIERLTLENFQSHEYTELELTSGLNVLVGPSDSGKTAVIRAIKWALYNEPRGTEFMRQGATYCRVTLRMSNGYTIVRERSSSYNRYILIDPDGQKQIFEGFGNDIPLEILRAHGIRKVILDENNAVSINLGQQLEGPFMLAETGATRAKALGRLVGVHIIDRAMQSTVTDITRLQQQIKQWDQQLDDLNSALEQFDYLGQLERSLNEQGDRIDKLELLIAHLDRLLGLRQRLAATEAELGQIKGVLEQLKAISAMEQIVQRIEVLVFRKASIESIYRRWTSVEQGITHGEALIKALAGVERAEHYITQAGALSQLLMKYVQKRSVWIAIEAEAEIQRRTLKRLMHIDQCQQYIDSAVHMVQMLKQMINLRHRFKGLNDEIHGLEQRTRALGAVDQCQVLLSHIEKRAALLEQLRDIAGRFDEANKRLNEGQRYIRQIIAQINDKADRYGEVLMKVGRCPICMSDIDVSTVERIISAYRR